MVQLDLWVKHRAGPNGTCCRDQDLAACAPGAPLPASRARCGWSPRPGVRGGGGPRRGPRPPGSTNFSASSSSILLLFFSLKERENKRRVSITLHIGRRERMGGEGTGRGSGRTPGGGGHRPLPRSLTTQPGLARPQSRCTYGSSPSAILFSASSQVPPRQEGPGVGAGPRVDSRREGRRRGQGVGTELAEQEDLANASLGFEAQHCNCELDMLPLIA